MVIGDSAIPSNTSMPSHSVSRQDSSQAMLISLDHVSYHSKTSGQLLLDDITFEIPNGKITTIIGPNGAGKSTLLKLMLALVMPSEGTVHRRKGLKLGYMPQKLVLNNSLPLTVERFLTLSKRHTSEKTRTTVDAVLKRVRSLHTKKQSVHTLSGGEWQRVLLARALLQSPDVLMLDEPVQALDHSGQMEFYHLLRHISADLGCAVVHVSHDLHLVWDASDRVICLNKHICCQGAPELVRNDPLVRDLFGEFAPYIHHHTQEHTSHSLNEEETTDRVEGGQGVASCCSNVHTSSRSAHQATVDGKPLNLSESESTTYSTPTFSSL